MTIHKILVVDDSKTELFHLSDILGKKGYAVRTAENGEEAMRRLNEDKPDLILMDVVIGWGAHADPATELAKAIEQAKKIATKGNRKLAIVGFVCGTELDPQVLAKQETILRSAGMVLTSNSANAAWLAAQWVK